MTLSFPDSICFGTSTSAYQIETAFDHDWEGVVAKDGYKFGRTTDHELRFQQDAEIIAFLAPNYRMSLMWSKLQRAPYAAFDADTVRSYRSFLLDIRKRNVNVMMVLYHWCNPAWFSAVGGWESRDSPDIFFDFARRIIDEFGEYVSFWNTFNEPNLYSTFSYGLGEFPPFYKDVFKSVSVIKNMAVAHERIAGYLKQQHPHSPVGLSHNTVYFASDNLTGTIPAKMADYWYMEYLPGFFESCDYVGISYYAKLAFDPYPVTYLKTPEKFSNGRTHDDIWEYYPQGLGDVAERYWAKFRKPIIITENGVCTGDDTMRVQSLKDYMTVIHSLLQKKIDIAGYYHWSAWDNFEWTLGPTYKFGLFDCHPDSCERFKKPSADVYSELAHHRRIAI
jgi:beta-glucosidase